MANYCDSKRLEYVWLRWLLAQATPALDAHRASGLVYSKPKKIKATTLIKYAKKTSDNIPQKSPKELTVNPYWGNAAEPRLDHIIVSKKPIKFSSSSGLIKIKLPNPKSLKICQESIEAAVLAGYIDESQVEPLWQELSNSIKDICVGIGRRFKTVNNDVREDLISDIYIQLMQKIKAKKVVFTPGRAPVFNLLTTTIYRLIFSALNKITKDKQNKAKHNADAVAYASRTKHRLGKRSIITRVNGNLAVGYRHG